MEAKVTYGQCARGFEEWYKANFTEVQDLFNGIKPMPVLYETGEQERDDKGNPMFLTNEDMFEDVEGFGLELYMTIRCDA